MTRSGRISSHHKFSTCISCIYRPKKPIKKCLTPLRLPVSLQSPCATSVPRSKTSVMKKPFSSSRLTVRLKKFGECGETTATSKMCQLHERAIFKPIWFNDMTQVERKRAIESLIFLVESTMGELKQGPVPVAVLNMLIWSATMLQARQQWLNQF